MGGIQKAFSFSFQYAIIKPLYCFRLLPKAAEFTAERKHYADT